MYPVNIHNKHSWFLLVLSNYRDIDMAYRYDIK